MADALCINKDQQRTEDTQRVNIRILFNSNVNNGEENDIKSVPVALTIKKTYTCTVQ